MTPLIQRPATELVAQLRAGELAAVEVFDAFAEQVRRVQPKINALVCDRLDEGRREALAADAARAAGQALGPLHGLPVSIKEMFDVAGTPTTAGLTTRRRNLAQQDGILVARLRQAGAIVLGKTNVPQLGLYAETDNPLYGRTNNPWDLERSPGGSSGGESALIAAGGSPLGLGSDGGGSIRQPAHVTGICGLKPTGGRLPLLGHWMVSNWPADWVQPGPMARTVDDLWLALQVLAQPNSERPQYGEFPHPPGDPARVAVNRLRVGFYEQLGDLPVVPAVRRAIQQSVRALQDAGVEVVPFEPPVPEAMWECFQVLLYAEGLTDMQRQLRGSVVDARIRDYLRLAKPPAWLRPLAATGARAIGQPRVAQALRMIRRPVLTGAELSQWIFRMHGLRMTMSRALDRQGLDALLGPPHPLPAWPHHDFYANATMAYTGIYNLLAMPAGVVPVTRVQPGEHRAPSNSRDWIDRSITRADTGSEGLPIGAQVIGRWWREDVVLALMRTIERQVRNSPEFPHASPLLADSSTTH